MTPSPTGQPLIQDDPERIEVRVPARAEYVAVVRLAAAGVAGRMGFSYEDIEDLKIAVAEACTDAVLSGKGPVTVSFDVGNGALDIAVRVAQGPARPAKDRELGLFLIQCLMDEVATVEEEDGTRVMRMAKRLPPTQHA